MKLTIILSLLSLSLLSLLSLSSADEAPVDYLCNFIDSQKGMVKGLCISVFDSYPAIRQVTSQGVALIANNVAKKRLKTLITSLKRYQSVPSIPPQRKNVVQNCLVVMRDLNKSLEQAVDMIMKRDYQRAVDIEIKLMRKVDETCDVFASPKYVQESFADFALADVVAYKAILVLRKKK